MATKMLLTNRKSRRSRRWRGKRRWGVWRDEQWEEQKDALSMPSQLLCAVWPQTEISVPGPALSLPQSPFRLIEQH